MKTKMLKQHMYRFAAVGGLALVVAVLGAPIKWS